jgi:hypothetical protein
MSYIGTVSKLGTVTLPPEANLAQGSKVEVIPLPAPTAPQAGAGQGPTLYEMFKEFIGSCEGPPDLAENHDHYAHGAPKR